MYAIVQGELKGGDGWKLDPYPLTHGNLLPPCPDCGQDIGEYDETSLRVGYKCDCGSRFDVWSAIGYPENRLVIIRSPYNSKGEPLKPKDDQA